MIVLLMLLVVAAVVFPGAFRLVVTLALLGFCVAVGYGGWVESREHSASPTSALGSDVH